MHNWCRPQKRGLQGPCSSSAAWVGVMASTYIPLAVDGRLHRNTPQQGAMGAMSGEAATGSTAWPCHTFQASKGAPPSP